VIAKRSIREKNPLVPCSSIFLSADFLHGKYNSANLLYRKRRALRATIQNILSHFTTLWRKFTRDRLLKNTSIYVIGNIIQRAAEFLLLPLWAAFLTPEDYGITGTMSAYVGVLVTLLSLGLPSSIARHYYDFLDDPLEQKRYTSSILVFQGLFSLAVTIILCLVGKPLWNLFSDETIPYLPFVVFMLWISFFRSVIQTPTNLYRAEQKAKEFIYVQWGVFLTTTISAIIFVVLLKQGAYGQMLSTLIAAGVMAFVVLFLVLRRWFVPKLCWSHIVEGLKYGLPIVPHTLSAWALSAADRIVLQQFVSLHDIGLYNFSRQISMAMQVLTSAINQAWAPHYYQMMAKGQNPDKHLVRVVSFYIAGIGGLCLAASLFMPEFFNLFLPESYQPGVIYTAPLLVGYFFLGMYYFASAPLFNFKKTNIIPLLSGGSALVNVLLNVWFVPTHGAYVAAWNALIGYALLMVSSAVIARKYQKIPYPYFKYIVFMLFLIGGIFMPMLFPTWNIPGILVRGVALLGYMLAGFIWLIRPYRKKNGPPPEIKIEPPDAITTNIEEL